MCNKQHFVKLTNVLDDKVTKARGGGQSVIRRRGQLQAQEVVSKIKWGVVRNLEGVVDKLKGHEHWFFLMNIVKFLLGIVGF